MRVWTPHGRHPGCRNPSGSSLGASSVCCVKLRWFGSTWFLFVGGVCHVIDCVDRDVTLRSLPFGVPSRCIESTAGIPSNVPRPEPYPQRTGSVPFSRLPPPPSSLSAEGGGLVPSPFGYGRRAPWSFHGMAVGSGRGAGMEATSLCLSIETRPGRRGSWRDQ